MRKIKAAAKAAPFKRLPIASTPMFATDKTRPIAEMITKAVWRVPNVFTDKEEVIGVMIAMCPIATIRPAIISGIE